LEICKKALVLANVLCTYHLGVMGMIKGMVVVSLLSAVLNTYHSSRMLSYGLFTQLKDTAMIMLIAGAIFLSAFELSTLALLPPWGELLAGGSLAVVIFGGGLRLLDSE